MGGGVLAAPLPMAMLSRGAHQRRLQWAKLASPPQYS